MIKSSPSQRHYEFHCLTMDETGELGKKISVGCFIWHCSRPLPGGVERRGLDVISLKFLTFVFNR